MLWELIVFFVSELTMLDYRDYGFLLRFDLIKGPVVKAKGEIIDVIMINHMSWIGLKGFFPKNSNPAKVKKMRVK